MYEHEGTGRKKARAMLNRAGYAAGGHVTAKHVGKEIVDAVPSGPVKAKRKLADGGVAADGEAPTGRLDKPSRGGKGKGMTVNIVVGAPKAAQPMPIPMPPPPAAAGGAPRPPAMPPQMPMGQQPNPMAGGMPPMGLKRGGRAGAKMDAGALSGEGRLEKVALQKKARR